MTAPLLRVVVADDERATRRLLTSRLKSCEAVQVVGEAGSASEALEIIEKTAPDLALLDLQIPEVGGLDVVRRLPAARLPLVAFVTAFDEVAVEAFELHSVDYLLKPAEQERVDAVIERARRRLAQQESRDAYATTLAQAAVTYERFGRRAYLERVPLKRRDEVIILPVREIACITAEGEWLHVTTTANEVFTISHRLHAIEARLDPRRFVRLSRSTLANLDQIRRINTMPGGTYTATLANGQQLAVSRIQSKILRETLLKL
jgi:two-component system LytT family response regulator